MIGLDTQDIFFLLVFWVQNGTVEEVKKICCMLNTGEVPCPNHIGKRENKTQTSESIHHIAFPFFLFWASLCFGFLRLECLEVIVIIIIKQQAPQHKYTESLSSF